MRDQEPQKLLGDAPAFQTVLEHVSSVAPLNKPVLIIGERGTGKELIASRLHFLSQRWEETLLKINCAALPESLLESELFGYEAGSFTGAGKRHQGRFERADGGTLFLDEIASMSMPVQEKLLRVIEYGEFERVGGSETLTVNIRIIGAANADLPALAREGKFREDLLDRLSFDVITLPPLRARQEDIELLATHFATGMVKELKRELFQGFSQAAMKKLQAYQWPGNIRELKNVVERAVYRNDGNKLIDEIEFDPFESPFRPKTSNQSANEASNTTKPVSNSTTVEEISDFRQHIREYEISCLQSALELNRHHQQNTAKSLGLTYNQLRSYLRKYSDELVQDEV